MSWECITEYILLDVFKYLDPDQIKRAARVCKWWRNVAEDSRLWRLKVQQLFHTKVICPAPGVDSWRAEWERIEKWAVRSSVFKQHAHNSGVTHSSFSPDGLTLVTCGNDARVVVWRVKNNANLDLIWEDNFSRYNWSYCTTVQFNKSGSSFLVAGVLRTNIARTRKGEIIVVSAEDHDLGTIKSRIDTRPYDSEGCWFNNNYVISSDHDWLTHGVSVNKLWINKINFTEDSEPSLACMRQLYSLYNCAGASIRNLQVCNVPRQNRYVYRQYTGYSDTDTAVAGQLYLAQHQAHHLIPVPCTDRTAQLPEDVDNRTIRYYWDGRYIADYDENQSAVQDSERILIHYSPEYHQDRMQDHTEGTDDSADWLWEDESVSEEEDEYQWEYFTGSGQEEKDEIVLDLHINEQVLNEADKLLIFTTGHRTYLPHQLGVKLMSSVKFKQHLDINRDIQDFIREGNQRREDERQRLERKKTLFQNV